MISDRWIMEPSKTQGPQPKLWTLRNILPYLNYC